MDDYPNTVPEYDVWYEVQSKPVSLAPWVPVPHHDYDAWLDAQNALETLSEANPEHMYRVKTCKGSGGPF